MAKLVTTDVAIGGKTVKVPIIKNRFGRHIVPACFYLHDYLEKHPKGSGSAITYGENLVSFLSHLERVGVELEDFTDAHLIEWMNEQAKRGNRRGVIQSRLDTVFRFAVWLANNGHDDIVRLPSTTYPKEFVFRLSSRPDTSERRRAAFGIVSGLTAPGEESDRQPTPTTEQVSRLAVAAAQQPTEDARERNELLISWYHDVGLRRAEVLALPVIQIPSFEEIARMSVATEHQEVVLEVTKGGRPRWVGVLPNLLERTREYIEGPRKRIVERFASSYGKNGPPKEVFLSLKTGGPLELRSASNIFTKLFNESKVEGHGHRIRATFLTNLFDEEYEAQLALRNSLDSPYRGEIDFELLLRRVAEKAGHRDPESLRHYVVILRKRHLREAGVDKAVALAQLIASREVELAALEERVAQARLLAG